MLIFGREERWCIIHVVRIFVVKSRSETETGKYYPQEVNKGKR